LDLRGVSEGETPGRTALGQFVTIFEEFPALREVAKENLLTEKKTTLILWLFPRSLWGCLSPWAQLLRRSHRIVLLKIRVFLVLMAPRFPINPRFAFAARICDDTMDSQKSAQKAFLASVRGE
jgi:hypothetical protein